MKNNIFISIIVSSLLFNACSTKGEETIAVSSPHLYNENYGVLNDPQAEEMLEKEKLVQQNPVEVHIPKIDDPSISLEPNVDPEAVTEDKLVIPPPVITYKYPFDPVFYTENQVKNKKR
jgi:hypothetical protein